jgi:hypothetical protein
MSRTTLATSTIAALTLLASTAAAQAQQRMPAELAGQWCPVPRESDQKDFPVIYGRGKKCFDSDSWMTVTPSGYRAHEEDCKLLKVTTDSATRVHRMRFQCSGEGTRWNKEAEMQRAMGLLLVRWRWP